MLENRGRNRCQRALIVSFIYLAGHCQLPAAEPTSSGRDLVSWPSAEIRWCYIPNGAPSYFSGDNRFVDLIKQAMDDWEDGTAVRFRATERGAQCQFGNSNQVLTIQWGTLDPRERARGALSFTRSAYFKGPQDSIVTTSGGFITVNEDIDHNKGPGDEDVHNWTRTFVGALTHELGHVLGLRHSLDRDSIMWPVSSIRYTPSLSDLRMIATLYGDGPWQVRSASVRSASRNDVRFQLVDQELRDIATLDGNDERWVFVRVSFPETVNKIAIAAYDARGRERSRLESLLPIKGQPCMRGACAVTLALDRQAALANSRSKIYGYADERFAGELIRPATVNIGSALPELSILTQAASAEPNQQITLKAVFSENNRGLHTQARWLIPSTQPVYFDVPPEGGAFDLSVSFYRPGFVDAWLTLDSPSSANDQTGDVSFGVEDLYKTRIEVKSSTTKIRQIVR